MGIYRNNLKNREFGKEDPQNFCSQRATIAEWQDASENKNYEVNPTQPKTDSSSCFGIRLCLSVLFVFSLCSATLAQKESQARLIDLQIQELQEKKLGFEAKVVRHENLADRLQFNDEIYLETRRHIQLVDENRIKAEAVQQEIDRLQAEKELILKR